MARLCSKGISGKGQSHLQQDDTHYGGGANTSINHQRIKDTGPRDNAGCSADCANDHSEYHKPKSHDAIPFFCV